LSMVY